MKSKWVEWWQSLPALDRFRFMRKYEVKQVTDKLIKKMWLGAVIESLTQDKFCKVCNLPSDGEKCYSKRCPI